MTGGSGEAGVRGGVLANTSENTATNRVLRWAEIFKRVIAGVLLAMMALLVVVATGEIVFALVTKLLGGPIALENPFITQDQLLEVFGVFLTVLIALELLETVEVYFREHAVHIEIVLLVAMIALSRKFILLDPHAYSALTLLALAAILLALGATYWLVRRAGPAE
jgi:uncharacterized membrane protein (DUF373 family)